MAGLEAPQKGFAAIADMTHGHQTCRPGEGAILPIGASATNWQQQFPESPFRPRRQVRSAAQKYGHVYSRFKKVVTATKGVSLCDCLLTGKNQMVGSKYHLE
jgi:hypothetical protein